MVKRNNIDGIVTLLGFRAICGPFEQPLAQAATRGKNLASTNWKTFVIF